MRGAWERNEKAHGIRSSFRLFDLLWKKIWAIHSKLSCSSSSLGYARTTQPSFTALSWRFSESTWKGNATGSMSWSVARYAALLAKMCVNALEMGTADSSYKTTRTIVCVVPVSLGERQCTLYVAVYKHSNKSCQHAYARIANGTRTKKKTVFRAVVQERCVSSYWLGVKCFKLCFLWWSLGATVPAKPEPQREEAAPPEDAPTMEPDDSVPVRKFNSRAPWKISSWVIICNVEN